MIAERELPAGWDQVTLAELIDRIEAGKNFRCIERPPLNGEVGVVKVSAVSWGRFREEESKTVPPGLALDPETRICQGDLLFSRANTIELVGACVMVESLSKDLRLSDKILRLVAAEEAIKPWIYRYLSSPEARKYLSEASSGNQLSMRNISQRVLLETLVPLAPLNEQRRIAAKLDTALAAVQACRQRLDGVAAILKRFRQAVLAAATSGELTREWREETGAPAWTIEKASEVCSKVQSGGTPKDGFIDEPGVPFLKVYNLVGQKVDFAYKPQFVRPEAHLGPLAKSRVKAGDILMNIVGPPLGKVAITPDDYDEWNINQAITLFRPSERIRGQWIYMLLCEGSNIRGIELQTKGSAGQINISLTQCREFKFPVPVVNEQDEIIAQVDDIFVFAEQLDAKLTAAREIVDRLTPALLAKAFRGELVPQDPNDEPASDLLSKLMANKSNAAAESPRRRSSSSTRRRTMSITDKDSIKAVILSLRTNRFSFDELRVQAGGDYESLRAVLFELLEEPSPVVRQVFDQEAKAIKLERIRQ